MRGIAFITARRQCAAGTRPVPTYRLGRLDTFGSPMARASTVAAQAVEYTRVSSEDERADLDRQFARVAMWPTSRHLAVSRVMTEGGSALDELRKKFLARLGDREVATIVAEHRAQFFGFVTDYVRAFLASQSRRLVFADPAEAGDDQAGDITEILASLYTRLYGCRAPANRALRAVEGTTGGPA